MDRAKDAGEGWRRDICFKLRHLGINWLDPTRKPIDIGKEDAESRKRRGENKRAGDWPALVAEMKPIRCVDLRMVDVCDFVIVYLDLDVHACGTYEEVFLANRQKKPVLFVVEQGKHAAPDWLFGAFPSEYFFSSWDELYDYLEKIAGDVTYKDTNGRWYFFNWTGTDADEDWSGREDERVITIYHPDPSRRMRTLVKSVGWESFSFILTLMVSYFVVGSIEKASELTVILFILKVLFLYGYERLWHKIRWGKYASIER
jgi:uncharacterized membrane protein